MKSKYKSIGEWRKHDVGAYQAAIRLGLIDEICKTFGWYTWTQNSWTLDACKTIAKKYKTVADWRHSCHGSFTAAKKNDWIPICTKHMRSKNSNFEYWSKLRCTDNCRHYISFTEWKRKSKDAYYVAKKNNWLDDCRNVFKKVKDGK